MFVSADNLTFVYSFFVVFIGGLRKPTCSLVQRIHRSFKTMLCRVLSLSVCVSGDVLFSNLCTSQHGNIPIMVTSQHELGTHVARIEEKLGTSQHYHHDLDLKPSVLSTFSLFGVCAYRYHQMCCQHSAAIYHMAEDIQSQEVDRSPISTA